MARTARDSAGIEIVELRFDEEALPSWPVDSVATWEVGEAEGADPYLLQFALSAVRLANGDVVVANAGSRELRAFDSAGRHRWSAGGRGEGPGEFANLGWVQTFHDSLIAFDRSLRRISVFTVDGEFVRSVRLGPPGGVLRAEAAGLFDDGTIVVRAAEAMTPSRPGGVHRTRGLVARYDEAGVLRDTIVALPGGEYHLDTELFILGPRPFGPNGLLAVADPFVYTIDTRVSEFRVFDAAGSLVRLVRWLRDADGVTDADVETFIENELARASSDSRRRQAQQRYDRVPFPEVFPSFRRILAAPSRGLWAERYPRPGDTVRRWIVFDDTFAPVARVTVPVATSLLEILDDAVLVRRLDELDVETIGVLPVRIR